jgi:N-acylglucosamine 2-epimerase
VNYELQKYGTIYVNSLTRDVIPFWEKNSLDKERGGYLTCLSRTGRAFDTDKFVIPQAGQVWAFAMLHNRLDKKAAWLEYARAGAEFLKKFGRDASGRWYEALDARGLPLRESKGLSVDAMAAMALGQYAQASGDAEAKDIAVATARAVLSRMDQCEEAAPSVVASTRPLKSLKLPVVVLEMVLDLGSLLDPAETAPVVDRCLREITTLFQDREKKIVCEYAGPDGSHPDCFEGRLMCPGRSFQAMRLVMDVARQRGDRDLARASMEYVFALFKLGWDQQHGGIFLFADSLGKPLQQTDWDQKHWWVHLEALTALAVGYAMLGRTDIWAWFEKVHQYLWRRFPDPEYGEWFGYLSRKGDAVMTIKGGQEKGCFHLAKCLYRCHAEFHTLGESEKRPG